MMATIKFEILLLNLNIKFSLHIKMGAVLAQLNLDDALLGLDKIPSTLIQKEKQLKYRKALSQIHFYFVNQIL